MIIVVVITIPVYQAPDITIYHINPDNKIMQDIHHHSYFIDKQKAKHYYQTPYVQRIFSLSQVILSNVQTQQI